MVKQLVFLIDTSEKICTWKANSCLHKMSSLQFSQMEMRFLRKNKKSKAETYFLKTYVLFMKMVTKKSGQHLLSAPVL